MANRRRTRANGDDSAELDTLSVGDEPAVDDAEVEVRDEAPGPNDDEKPSATKPYMLVGVGGIPDGDWNKLDEGTQQWVKEQYPDTYAAIQRDLRAEGKVEAVATKAATSRKDEVIDLQKERDKAFARLSAARVANQAVTATNALDEEAARHEASIAAAEAETEALKEATKQGVTL